MTITDKPTRPAIGGRKGINMTTYQTRKEYLNAKRAIEAEIDTLRDRYPVVTLDNSATISASDLQRSMDGNLIERILLRELDSMTYVGRDVFAEMLEGDF